MTIVRNEQYWAGAPPLPAVRFMVVPDATTRALELRKGSADVAINALTADTVFALRDDPALVTVTAPGTIYAYLAFNLRDPILRDVRVRQAHGLCHRSRADHSLPAARPGAAGGQRAAAAALGIRWRCRPLSARSTARPRSFSIRPDTPLARTVTAST